MLQQTAIPEIAEHLREHRYALKLNPVTGGRRPARDRALAKALESHERDRRARGVLEALYAVRCNMFHGRKAFEALQLPLLRPAISLLESTVETLYNELERNI